MRVLCSWCLKAGKSEPEALIGEKGPITDERASHGICPDHRQEVEDAVARLREEAERQQKDAETLRRHVDP